MPTFHHSQALLYQAFVLHEEAAHIVGFAELLPDVVVQGEGFYGL